MEDKIFQSIAEAVIRIVCNNTATPVELKTPYSDLTNMVAAQIKHDCSVIVPNAITFQKEVTKFLVNLEGGLSDSQSITHSLEELKTLVSKLNKQYLTPEFNHE